MIFQFFKDGKLFITIPIFILLVVILALFVKALIKKEYDGKLKKLIASISWFTIAWGYLGRTLALIGSFDAIQAVGEISPKIVAPGLKTALIDPLFAILVFLIARVGIIILIVKQKKQNNPYESTDI